MKLDSLLSVRCRHHSVKSRLGTAFSDYDRRTGNNKTRPKNWCRQFARPRKVTVYDSLDRLANASERTATLGRGEAG